VSQGNLGHPCRQRCGEQRGLPLPRRLREDALNVGGKAAVKHLVSFVEDEQGDAIQRHIALPQMVEGAAGRTDDYLSCLQRTLLGSERATAVEHGVAQSSGGGQRGEHRPDLDRQLTGGYQHESLDGAKARVGPLDERQHEGERLARASAGLPDHIPPGQQYRDGIGLYRGRLYEVLRLERALDSGSYVKLGERRRPTWHGHC
jgi:hypothetical protein